MKGNYTMSKELFENVGRDIKNIAKKIADWIFILHCLAGLVLFLVGCVLVSEGIYTTVGVVAILVAFGVVAFGYAISRLAVILLYGYGEMAYRLISIDQKITGSVTNQDKQNENKRKEKKVKGNQEIDETIKKPAWECQFCGHKNPEDTRFCKSCGTEDIEI